MFGFQSTVKMSRMFQVLQVLTFLNLLFAGRFDLTLTFPSKMWLFSLLLKIEARTENRNLRDLFPQNISHASLL